MSQKKQSSTKKQPNQDAFPSTNTGLTIALFIIAALLYVNTIPNDYNLDDELVTNEHRLTSGGMSAIPSIFTSPYYEDNMGYAYEYRPVTLTSFAIEHQLFGDNPHISHFLNVLLYGLTAVVLFVVLQHLFKGYRYNYILPLVATLLFIVHPIHTEVVASIKNRDELLCLLGGLGSLYFALRYIDYRSIAPYVLSTLLLVVGLLSKRSIVPFVLIIPLALSLFRQPSLSQLLLWLLPWTIITPLFAPVFLLIEKITIGLVVIIAPLIFHIAIHHSQKLITVSIQWWQKTYGYINQTFYQSFSSEEAPNKSDLLDFNASILGSVIVSLLAIVGVFFNLFLLFIISLLILCLITILSNTKQNQLPLTGLSIVVSFGSWAYDVEILMLLFSAYFALEMLVKSRINLKLIPAALILFAASYPINGWEMVLYEGITFLIVWAFSKQFLQLPVLISMVIISLLVLVFNNPSALLTPIYFSVLLSAIYWRPNLLSTPVPLSIFMLIGLTAIIFLKEPNAIHESRDNMIVNNQQPPTLRTPAPQALPSDYRELEYVENPIPHLDNTPKQLGISFYALGTYLQKLTIPHPLNYYYGYRKIPVVSLSHPFVIGSILVYLALAVLTVYFFFRNRKILAFGIGVFLVSILPFSNLISPVAGMVGERLAYVASLGFCLALAYVLLWLFNVDLKRAKPSFAKLPTGFVILVGLLLLLGSFKTIQRNNQWEDSLTLFRNDILHLQESAQAHNLLASHLVQEANKIQQRREQRKMRQEAIQHFKKAVEIHPEFFNPIYDLGRTYLLVGNQEEAKKAFKRAIEVNPDFPNSYLKLANMFYENEEFDKAIPYYREVIELSPNKVGAFTNLSFIYFKKGEYQKSIEVNQKALQNNPQAVNPRINLGKTYMRMGDNQNAIRYFEEAFELQPNNLNVAKSLVQLYQEQGNTRKANYYKRQARNLSQQGRR